jgi:hypothetical protein
MCEPTTVTLVAPVEGLLTMTTVLGADAAIDTAEVSVPTRTTTVAMTLTVRTMPAADLVITEESATHSVASLELPPMRCPVVQRMPPALVPTTVTVVDPVEAMFVDTTVLDSGDA